jgi:integrase
MIGESDGVRYRRDDESYVEYYLNHRNDIEENTGDNYRRAWSQLNKWCDETDRDVERLEREDVREFCAHLRRKDDDEVSEMTGQRTIRHLSRMVNWLVNDADVADYNPYNSFTNYFNPEQEDTEKLEVEDSELREALQAAKEFRIELFVYLTTLLKTGMRSSEVLNLDLRDINLDHPISRIMPDARLELQNHADTLYVDSTVNKGKEHNGEVRQSGNKENSTRKIPIDDELKQLLVWWIAMLPTSSSLAKPLIRKVTDPEARRMSSSQVQELVTEWSRDNGLNSLEMKHFGVDSHWCRHWFTTTMQANIDQDEVSIGTPKAFVKGLRGDTDSDTIATYTQDWEKVKKNGEKTYREVCVDNIPKLFTNEGQSGQ